ncbi:MAG: hypothetical protein ACO310_01800, partial [Burkholderiaceae bacterium]
MNHRADQAVCNVTQHRVDPRRRSLVLGAMAAPRGLPAQPLRRPATAWSWLRPRTPSRWQPAPFSP